MSVTIDLDIRASDVTAKLKKVKEELNDLEDDFDFSFGGDFKTQLDGIADRMDEIGKSFSNDLDDVATRLENLEVDVTEPAGGGDSGGGTGSDSGDYSRKGGSGGNFDMRQILARARHSDFSESFTDIANKFSKVDRDLQIQRDVDFDDLQKSIDGVFGDDFGFDLDEDLTKTMGDGRLYGQTPLGPQSLGQFGKSRGFGDEGIDVGVPGFSSGGGRKNRTKMGRLGKSAKRLSNNIGELRGAIRTITPSMNKWWRVIALAIPVLITVGAQALGVAAAMGSLAVAGAAFIGLGLVGHGDSMAESWANAQKQLSQLKEDMFETFQPSMQTFAPIQDAFFDVLPQNLRAVNAEMKQLAGSSYQFALFDATRGTTEFIAELINRMVEMDGIASQLAMRFGDIVGSNILDFFSWLVREAYRNQESLIQLGSIIVDIVEIIYNLSKVFSQLLIIFAPVITAVLWLSRALETRMARAIFSIIVVLGVVGALFIKTIAILAKLRIALVLMSITGSGAMASFAASALSALGSVQASIVATIAGLSTLQKALATTGLGLLLVGGGYLAYEAMKPSGPPSGGSSYSGYTGSGGGNTVVNEGDTFNFNVDGSTDDPTAERMYDVATLNSETEDTRSLSMSDSR
jgi:hypothetical protein